MKKILFVSVILVEIISVVTLTHIIINKKNTLGIYTVNPIKKESLVFVPTENLEYFYEPNSKKEINTNEPYSQGVLYTINSDSLNEKFEYNVKNLRIPIEL